MPPRSRRPDPAAVRTALSAQWAKLVERTTALTPADREAPSRIDGWTVADLVAHIALTVRVVQYWLDQPAPDQADVDLAEWTARTATVADEIAKYTRAVRQAGTSLQEVVESAEKAIASTDDDRVVRTVVAGGMRFADMLTTRLIEAVVHADDLD